MTVGLDLGRASVKLVRKHRSEFRSAEVAVDPALEGEARDQAVSAALSQARAELDLRKGAQVHVAVPRATAIVKHLTLPAVDAKELPALLSFQASKVIPFDLSEMSLTWGALGSDASGGQRYVLAAVRNKTLDELRKIVTDAGLVPGRLEVSSQAAARCVPATAGEALLVDVGHATSDVLLLRDGGLLYSRSASVGLGTEGWAERLPQEVARSLVAARTEGGASERVGPPDALFIAGGGAADEVLRAALSSRLRIPAEPLSVAGEDDAGRSARLVVARGLLEEARPGIPYLDLAQRERVEAAASTRRRITVGAMAGGVALVLSLVGGYTYLESQDTVITELTEQRADLETAVGSVKAVQRELRRVKSWDERKGRELEALLAVTEALPGDDEAYLTELRWTEGRGLTLRGRAKTWANVDAFFSRMEQSPFVRSATPEQVSVPKEKRARGVQFAGQVRLRGVSK